MIDKRLRALIYKNNLQAKKIGKNLTENWKLKKKIISSRKMGKDINLLLAKGEIQLTNDWKKAH